MSNKRPYKLLSSSTSLRVLHLLPAQKYSDPLECRLLETDFDENLEYIAVSYVWGDETNPSMILTRKLNSPLLVISMRLSEDSDGNPNLYHYGSMAYVSTNRMSGNLTNKFVS